MRPGFRLAVLPAVLALSVSSLLAQPIDLEGISDQDLRNQRRTLGDSISFCVNATSLLADFERALAAELSQSLLLDYEIFEINTIPATPAYDFRLTLDDLQIYRLLSQRCDALLGFTLLAEYPNWMAPSAVYLSTPTVLAVRDGEYGSLEEIPPGQAIGTRAFSLSDGFLLSYLQSLPLSSRLSRMVYPDNRLLIERLMDGSVEAILIWEVAIRFYQAEHPDAAPVDIIEALPFTIAPTQFVLALPPQEHFLNLMLDQAIAELHADGTIERLAIAHGIMAPSE